MVPVCITHELDITYVSRWSEENQERGGYQTVIRRDINSVYPAITVFQNIGRLPLPVADKDR